MPDTLTRYVGETKPFLTQLTAPVENPVTGVTQDVPIVLTGLVSDVRFIAQDADTGDVLIDESATIEEVPGNDDSIGRVRYTPTGPQVADPDTWIQWWRLVMLADGSTQDTGETVIHIVEHGIVEEAPTPSTGVCAAWATNEDVFRYGEGATSGVDYEPWLIEASEILYTLSGRQFANGCSRTVRPAETGCRCFQVLSRGHIVYPPDWEWLGGWWTAENLNRVGCGLVYSVELPGHATSVDSVKISGVTIDPATYRLDRNCYLIRLIDSTTGQNPGWPQCQDISLDTDQPGTFEIVYTWGLAPPLAGVRAAALLAYQLYLADSPAGGECMLPAGWTSVSRQGITVSRSQRGTLPTQGTGIVGIDSFLTTYNPHGLDQRPAVYSPDVVPLPYRVS